MQTAHLETNGTVIRPIDLGLYQRLTVIERNFSARTLFGCFIGLMLVIGAIALFDRTYFSAAILLAMCAFMIATPVAALVTIGHDTLTVLDPRRAFIVDSQIFIFMVVVVMCLLLLFSDYTIADDVVVLVGCVIAFFPGVLLFRVIAAARLRKLKQSVDPEQWRFMVENYARYRMASVKLVAPNRTRAQTPEQYARPGQSAAEASRLDSVISARSFTFLMLLVLGILGQFSRQFPEAYYYMAVVAGALVLYWIWHAWRSRGTWREPVPDGNEAKALYDAHTAPNVEHVLSVDPRQPILYLRSFHDDQAFRLFERSLGRFNGLGPLIALGSPLDKTPPVGAYYSYSSSDRWKDRIAEYMRRARIIILVPAVTEGVDWEIATIRDLGFLEKTALVFPYGLSERKRRYETVRRAVSDRLPAINTVNIEDTVILHFFVPHSITNIFQTGYGRVAVGRFELPAALALAAADSYSIEEMKALAAYKAPPPGVPPNETPPFHTPGPWG